MTRLLLSAAAIALLLSAQPIQAHEGGEGSDDADFKTAVESIVKEYILAHPDVLIQSLENQRMEAEKKMEEQAKAGVKTLLEELKTDEAVPYAGTKDAKFTVVEFFDYNCGYCKKAFEEIRTVLDEDKDIKIYLIDMPILGPSSLEASKWALAAHKQGKYFEFHKALMEHQGGKDDKVLESKAKDAGLDIKKAIKDKNSEEIQNQIDANMKRAELLNITGTPGFVVGDELVRGYMTLDQLKEMIAAERKGETPSTP